MPIYKAFILNREINLNYEYNQKEILIEAVVVECVDVCTCM